MRGIVIAMLAACVLAGCGRGKSWSEAAKEKREAEKPTVPYLVNTRSESPVVNLWSDYGRTESKARFHVPVGTKCKILDTHDVDKSRGGTMYLVKAVTGEEGWVPDHCIEYRLK